MQLKKLEHWCEAVRARAEKTLPSSLNTPTAAALLSSETLNVLTANPTVRGIQQLRKNSIQTIRDSADVLRHIIKNVSSRLVGTI